MEENTKAYDLEERTAKFSEEIINFIKQIKIIVYFIKIRNLKL